MYRSVFLFLLWSLVTEGLTEGFVKSELFKPFRTFVKKHSDFLGKLFSCGYCFSFWVAVFMCYFMGQPFGFFGIEAINVLLNAFVVQRLSNIIHNSIDKFTDKYYDVRYINTDKE